MPFRDVKHTRDPFGHRTLEVISYGGPIAVAMTSMGVLMLALAYAVKVDEHVQGGMVVAGATMVTLGFVEWALARRFFRHETQESVDRLELVSSLQEQHTLQLQLLIDNNQAILARAMLQIESVGAEYDHINTMLKKLTTEDAAHSVNVDVITEKVAKLSEEVADLLAWRERIAVRIPR